MFEIPFIGLAAFTVVTAIIAIEAREILYGAVALGLSFLGMAGLFIILEAPFVAMFQVIVYVGAIAVLILFTVMLVRREIWVQAKSGSERWVGIFGGIVLLLGAGYTAFEAGLTQTPTSEAMDFTLIGRQLLTDYAVALEVLALVLASALLGAITLAKKEKD